MTKLNYFFVILLLFIFSACGGLSDAKKVLKNEKVITTDEFLVKKREPLVMPPNYEEILKPGTKTLKKNEEENLKKILKGPKSETEKNKSSSIEDSILNRIRQ